MTPQELPLKKDPVSTSFVSAEEDFFTDLTLGTYLEAISHHEPLIPLLEHEQDWGLKLSTVKTSLAAIKAFLRLMKEKGLIGEEVFPWKLKIKVPETLPRVLDPEDVDRLLAASVSVRDRAMIMLLLRTGMRIGELLNTRVMDVNLMEQKILIYEAQKHHRGRVV